MFKDLSVFVSKQSLQEAFGHYQSPALTIRLLIIASQAIRLWNIRKWFNFWIDEKVGNLQVHGKLLVHKPFSEHHQRLLQNIWVEDNELPHRQNSWFPVHLWPVFTATHRGHRQIQKVEYKIDVQLRGWRLEDHGCSAKWKILPRGSLINQGFICAH